MVTEVTQLFLYFRVLQEPVIIDTLLNGLETSCFMLRMRHTYKNGVSFFLRQFCEAIIVKLTVLLVIEGL